MFNFALHSPKNKHDYFHSLLFLGNTIADMAWYHHAVIKNRLSLNIYVEIIVFNKEI